mgnify:CR=1 FL=1
MILVIDVGNTNITFGVYESKKLVTTFRMTSRTMRTSDEYGTEILAMLQNNQIDRRKVGGAIIASVVPKVMHALIGAVVRSAYRAVDRWQWNQNRHQDHFREPKGNRTGQNCGRSRRL